MQPSTAATSRTSATSPKPRRRTEAATTGAGIAGPRILGTRLTPAMNGDNAAAIAAHAGALGFTHIMLEGPGAAAPDLLLGFNDAVRAAGLALLVEAGPEAPPARPALPLDPRHPLPLPREALAPAYPLPPDPGAWGPALAPLRAAGIAGLYLRGLDRLPSLASPAVAEAAGALALFVDASGLPAEALATLPARLDGLTLSLPWWDGRASWLVAEHRRRASHGPVLGLAGALDKPAPADLRLARQRAVLAALLGDGWLLPATLAPTFAGEEGAAWLTALNAVAATPDRRRLTALTGAGAPITWLQVDSGAASWLIGLNPDPVAAHAAVSGWTMPTGTGLSGVEPLWPSDREMARPFDPLEVRAFRAQRLAALPQRPLADAAKAERIALDSPRLVIDRIQPAVDGGRYATRMVVGEPLQVEATIFMDGHGVIAAELQVAPDLQGDDIRPVTIRLEPLGNDRWRGSLVLDRIGRHRFRIMAWSDLFATYRRDLTKKIEAGLDVTLEIREGAQLIEAVHSDELTAALAAAPDDTAKLAVLLAAETASTMAALDPRPHGTYSSWHPVEVERLQARFASWYELFPRSQTNDPARHGTFDDVIARLPAIRAMGFDVLYFPPIHPIGQTHRKGRNNSLSAGPEEPGSPYAIGSDAGGHEALHPQLGSFADFAGLVEAAAAQGLEIALDFAIQCSPDHPWLHEQPGWFVQRPDGTIKYAENPPKKYQDIVNVEFYAPGAIPSLWLRLRDVVLFWIGHGVKIFRVDNPHTKPLPFWEWMIAEVRNQHPDAIFLAEAFTRPAMMYHLAKIGFSQSYTYFTWRNQKDELKNYIEELNQSDVRHFYRPHFFVNTPDINPVFLHHSGRPGFLIRAALGATLSGLFGLYSGFELCEATPVAPGKEEYLDSEKYEIRLREWNADGNIIAAIAQLNDLRRAEPALQSHLNTTFHNAFNDQIIYFAKHAAGHHDLILVAISLDPYHEQSAGFEVPLWRFDLPDDGTVAVEDLLNGDRFTWSGKMQTMHLTPEHPYRIWRIQPHLPDGVIATRFPS